MLVAAPAACSTSTARAASTSRVEILVLDEADRMLDMGFIHDVKKVLANLPAQRQNLLSRRPSPDIIALANAAA